MKIYELIEVLYKNNIYFHVKENKLQIQAPKNSMTDELMSLLSTHKDELIKYVLSVQTNRGVIEPVGKGGGGFLSYTQQRFWLLDHLAGGSVHYNMPIALKLSGKLNPEALLQAFQTIIDRHESLRTSFVIAKDGQPSQIIKENVSFTVPFTDLTLHTKSERQIELSSLLSEEASRKFELSHDLMLRAQLVKIAESEHILAVTMHHIASDGWSMGILINEFKILYSAYAKGLDNPLAPLKIQYSDYAHWQRNWLQGEVLDQQLDYWTKQCLDLPVVHNLPLDRMRPLIQSFSGDTYDCQISARIIQSLSALCQAQGATLFMGLHAAFSVLLSRYSNDLDIVMGTPVANREQTEIAPLIGCFVNTLLLRSDLSGDPNFLTLLSRSKDTLLDAYAHQQVPFEKIVEQLQPERGLSHNPLFQIIFVLQNNEQGVLELPELVLSPLKREAGGSTPVDLTINMHENSDGLFMRWEYSTQLFEHSTVVRMANHFVSLLESLVGKPDQSVFSVEMLSSQERHQLLVERNDTAVLYPKNKCVHELFDAQVKLTPHAVAVVFENFQLTYDELNQKANRLAHYLIEERQVKPDMLVGICVERSLDMVVGVLAILKAGCAYVPLDPTLPEKLLAAILDDIGEGLLLTETKLTNKFQAIACQTIVIDAPIFASSLLRYSTNSPRVEGLNSDNLAYVLYTSGSTGKPKAIAMPHIALVNLLGGIVQASPILKAPHRLVQFSSIGFDMSFEDIFLTINQGGCLILVDNDTKTDITKFVNLVIRERISALNLPYSMLQLLSEYCARTQITLPKLQCIISTAERLKVTPAIRSFFSAHTGCQLINHYGPSETHVVTVLNLNNQVYNWAEFPSIGRPIMNVSCYVLDLHMQPVPVGVTGQLYIGGDCLARGYLNQANLTEASFIRNPFSVQHNARLYRTGDMVRWTATGELEYLGRIDHQVKVRGFRIELGAIERELVRQGMDEVLVVVHEDGVGEKQLVAYYRAMDEKLDVSNLRNLLLESLPVYMVPTAFVALDKFPLTHNGKIDRRALPAPNFIGKQAAYVAPSTEVEEILCRIWQEILGIERVGVNDSFFALGGHSLSATRLVARINEMFKIEFSLKALFLSADLLAVASFVVECLTLQKNEILKEENKKKIEVEW